jgi:hypothetical protein
MSTGTRYCIPVPDLRHLQYRECERCKYSKSKSIYISTFHFFLQYKIMWNPLPDGDLAFIRHRKQHHWCQESRRSGRQTNVNSCTSYSSIDVLNCNESAESFSGFSIDALNCNESAESFSGFQFRFIYKSALQLRVGATSTRRRISSFR